MAEIANGMTSDRRFDPVPGDIDFIPVEVLFLNSDHPCKRGVDRNEGGSQIEYEDEERAIHDLFEAELTSVGAICRMKAFIPWCTGEVGPTNERET